MRRLLFLAMISLGAGSAHASGTISCVGEDGVRAELAIGSLPVLGVVGASIEAGAAAWSTQAGDVPETIAIGQAFQDGERMMIDFTDPNIERVLIELRLQTASEEQHFATVGTLRIVGQGAYALTCTGP